MTGVQTCALPISMNSEKAAFQCDPLFQLLERSRGASTDFSRCSIPDRQVQEAIKMYAADGVIGVIKNYLKNNIVNQFIDHETERQVIALKTGFPGLPATTCSTIMRGFGHDLSEQEILSVYASHGLARGMKELLNEFDFVDINRRIKEFDLTLTEIGRAHV